MSFDCARLCLANLEDDHSVPFLNHNFQRLVQNVLQRTGRSHKQEPPASSQDTKFLLQLKTASKHN